MIRPSSLTLLFALLPGACGSPSAAVTANSNTAPAVGDGPVATAPVSSSAQDASRAPTGPSSSASAQQVPGDGTVGAVAGADHATVNESLKRELVGAGKLDGSPLTDVRMTGRCSTAFVTAEGTVTVNWTKVGNFAGELDNGTATLPIADDQGRHVFTIADGPGFRRVDGGMGLLSDDCQS